MNEQPVRKDLREKSYSTLHFLYKEMNALKGQEIHAEKHSKWQS